MFTLLFSLALVSLICWMLWPELAHFEHCNNGFPSGWIYDDSADLTTTHKGGGSVPNPPKQKEVKLPPLPAQQPLPPPPPPPPPPTQDMAAVDQAAADQKRKAARNSNGIGKTLLAGETGGYGGGTSTADGKKTLLG